jgi:hypothetical protein
MLAIDNFGKKSLQEINEFLAGQGLRFGIRLAEGDNGSLWWSEGSEGEGGAAEESNEDNPA